jgi:hypothetical protein
MAVTDDPGARLRSTRERLPDRLRKDILALGADAVPPLLEILNDEPLARGRRTGQGWPPAHAVDLLVSLKAAEAVPSMLRKLTASGYGNIIYDRITERLHELGAPVLEPALSMLTEVAENQEARHAICEVLGKLRIKDDRILAALLHVYEDDPEYGAMLLADYGDGCVLPRLQKDLQAFVPDFSDRAGRDLLFNVTNAFEDLGGKLPPELQARVDGWFERWDPPQEPPPPFAAPSGPEIGRNEPCPCGSGKKWKKCCIDKPQPSRAS